MNSHNNTNTVRALTEDDLQSMMQCLNTVIRELPDRDLFIPPSAKYMNSILNGAGHSVGVFDEKRLLGFASVVFPGLKRNNLGYYVGFGEINLQSVVQLEHICVLPEFRNSGIARTMILSIVSSIDSRHRFLLSTISPYNIPSLAVAFNCGQVIAAFSKIYGVDRYVMLGDLFQSYLLLSNRTVEISVGELTQIKDKLRQHYYGIGFGEVRKTIRFKRGEISNAKISDKH